MAGSGSGNTPQPFAGLHRYVGGRTSNGVENTFGYPGGINPSMSWSPQNVPQEQTFMPTYNPSMQSTQQAATGPMGQTGGGWYVPSLENRTDSYGLKWVPDFAVNNFPYSQMTPLSSLSEEDQEQYQKNYGQSY